MRLLGFLLFYFGQKESTVTSVKTLFCSCGLDGSFPPKLFDLYRLKEALKWVGRGASQETSRLLPQGRAVPSSEKGHRAEVVLPKVTVHFSGSHLLPRG